MDRADLEIFQPPQVPRLSIANLMVLTFFAGLALMAMRYFTRQDQAPRQLLAATQAASLLYGLILGVGFGGGIVLVAHGLRHRCFPLIAPGHWLLMYECIVLLPLVALVLVHRQSGGLPKTYLAVGILASAIQFSLLSTAVFASSVELRWKLLFGAIALGALVQVVQAIGFLGMTSGWNAPLALWVRKSLAYAGHILMYYRPALSIGIVVAAIIDIGSHQYRDWLHWLGVIVVVGSAVSSLIVQFIVARSTV